MNNNPLNRSLNRARWLVLSVWFGLALGPAAFGQTLLYKWNFDNATGTGNSLVVPTAVVDTADGYTGGNMSVINSGTTLSTPSASGLFGNTNAADLGLVNSGIYNTAGVAALAGGVGNMSAITNFTVSLWFKLNAGVTNFNSMGPPTQTQFNPRLFCIDSNYNTTTAADGNELYFGLAQPASTAAGQPERIQFGVFVPSGQQDASPFGSVGGNYPATFTNQWVFIAIAYTTNSGGTALVYVGTTNQTATLQATMTGIGTITSAAKWLSTSNLVEIGNRTKDGARPLMGTIDDVRLYASALTLAQVQAAQGIFLPPVITTPPVSDVVFPGLSPQFMVTASGSLPLAYQWMRNGTNLLNGGNITGSTSNVLTISGVSAADVLNNYQVIITNTAGAVTSSPVSLSLAVTNGAYEAAVLTNAPFAFYTFSELTDPEFGTAEAYDSIGVFNGTYGAGAYNGYDGIPGPQATADGLTGFPNTNTALGCIANNSPPNSYVTTPPFNLNNGVGTNVLTITAWINPQSGQVASTGIVFSRGGTTQSGFCYDHITNSDGSYRLGYNWNNDPNTYNWDSGLTPPQNMWSLVSLVITPTNATVYVININGLQFSTHVYNHVPQIFEGPTLIGGDSVSTARNFNGIIDEVALFGQAMTQSQLSSLFAAGSGIVVLPPLPTVSGAVWSPPTNYPGLSASATITATNATSYQWKAGLSGNYTNLADGANISGSATPTLTINSVQFSNALDYIVVVTNAAGAATSAPPATLYVLAPFPATNFTLNFGGTPIVEAQGTDWNTTNSWNPFGQASSLSAYEYAGSTYTIVVGSRLRTPLVANSVFPGTGTELVINGGGVYESNTVVNVGELRLKHNPFNPATNYFGHLVLNGGEVLNGDVGQLVLQGRVDVQANSVFYIDTNDGRSEQIDSWLAGTGNIFWHDATPPGGTNDFNVTGATNTFSGQWIVDQGGLLGSGAKSLGTNNIIVGTNGLTAAVETLYDVNNTNASLIIGANGKVYLHQNDHFASVTVNGTPLANGTYPFATLNSTYPANFPSSWAQQTGSTFTSGSGQIVVGNGSPSTPHITGIHVSGTTLSISATNGTAGGPWTLLQSTNVALPLSQWQTNIMGTFDGSGNLSTNILNTATNRQEFYILKVQ